ncbi:MAG: helix-turn-helix transcriptional regulator, partial [Candidatus Eremiobacterota bacterium]
MEALGLKQSEVAQQLGVDSSVVHNWRRGRSFPEPDRFAELAVVLETTRAFLLGETDDP